MAFSQRIILFLALILFGFLLSSISQFVIAYLAGVSLSEMMSLGTSLGSGSYAGLIRTSLFASHLFSIILPAIVYAWITQKRKIFEYFKLDYAPSISIFLIFGVMIFSAQPFVSFSFQFNEAIPLADWMKAAEDNTAEIMKEVLRMDSPWIFIVNLLLIAITPAIGEELLFRGVIQGGLQKKLANPHVAILIASILFSAFHLQFEGFLPRVVLGLVLGYSFYLSKSLWVPMVLHLLNNSAPIISYYFLDDDLNALDPSSAPQVAWWAASLSLLACIFLYVFAKILIKKEEDGNA